jgi:hypothetical protein
MTLSSNEIMERLYDEFGTDLSGIDECDAGICYNCGAIQEDGVEPDAREYFVKPAESTRSTGLKMQS